MKPPRYWTGGVPEKDDLGYRIVTEFVDGRMKQGHWALMSPTAWEYYGIGKFGEGYGQRYRKQPDGKWLKVEG